MASPLDRSFTPTQNPYTDPSMMESETDKSFSQSTLQQSAQKRMTNNDATIMQREREITDIAKGIIELADIFKDLSTMVIDQGTMLDRIDYNVERMAVDVKAADKELTVVWLRVYAPGEVSLTVHLRQLAISVRPQSGKSYFCFSSLLLACSFYCWSNRRDHEVLQNHHLRLQARLFGKELF